MNTIKRIRVIPVLTLLLLLILPAGFMIQKSAGAPPLALREGKLSPDLRERMRGAREDERVTVIVQYKRTASSLIDVLLQGRGASVLRRFRYLNARLISLPAREAAALAERQEINHISLDKSVSAAGHLSTTTGAEAVRVQTVLSLLGLSITTTLDGSGVGLAVLDSGIDTQHTSFQNNLGLSRVIASQDFTGENRTDDPYGHGTHVASAAAGNGQASGNVYAGIAPAANIINLRVLNSQGAGTTSSVLAALDWVMANRLAYNIRVVNLSLGAEAVDSYADDPICRAVRNLVDAGVVVVAAAGNNGKDAANNKIYGRIHSPGNEPAAITVGASNTFGTDARADDGVTTFSSRGPTRSFRTDESNVKHYDNLMKPDVVAPGNRIVWAQARDNYLVTTYPELDANVSSIKSRKMMYLSGSSMAAPVVAGAAALLLQVNPRLTPNLIKMILMYTAQPLSGFNQLEQGAGQINLEGAVRLAQALRNNLTAAQTGDPMLVGGVSPVSNTSIAEQNFDWSQGIILNRASAIGFELINRYQSVYGEGRLLGDGVIETDESQFINPQLMTSGVQLSESITVSDGASLMGGTHFLDSALLLGSGIIIGDGIMIGDGIVLGDGIVIGDGIVNGDARLQAQSAMIGGDDTAAMR